MTKTKYDQLWNDLIHRAIGDYLTSHNEYEWASNANSYKNELKDAIYNTYEKEYKPQFKDTYMIKKNKGDSENEDSVPIGSGEVKIDRHKVSALLYLSIVKNDKAPFIKLKKKRDNGDIFAISACHEIAYSISLNCIKSFIEFSLKDNPNCPHKNKFISNGAFDRMPSLICEEYENYRESIIPRMVWATEAIDSSRANTAKTVSTNVNMLANIFYFLELHASNCT